MQPDQMTPKSVLVVEDSADDEKLMLRAIRRVNTNLNIVVARDGVRALDFLGTQSPFDLVICDLKLPKADGVAVLEYLRANPRTLTTPAVIFSSSEELKEITRCRKAGASSYVRKPVDYHDFINAVETIVKYWLGPREGVSPFCMFEVVELRAATASES